MQGWHYGRGLIYLRPIFRLTKLTFLRARAIPGGNERRSHLRRERKAKLEKARGKKGGEERKAKIMLLV